MFIKSGQEGLRLRTSKEKSMDGRLFVQFVALILNCMIYRIYNASKKLQRLFRTRRHMLEELRSIKLIQPPHRQKIGTENRRLTGGRLQRIPLAGPVCVPPEGSKG